MGSERVSVNVEALRDLKRLLTFDEVLGAEWKRAMQEAADKAAGEFRERMPTATGKARNTIKPAVQNRPVPMWARVKFNVKARKVARPGSRGSARHQNPFRVMGALEGGARYHYSRGGGPTKGWWAKAIKQSHATAQRIIDRTTSDIERRWGKWKGSIWIRAAK